MKERKPAKAEYEMGAEARKKFEATMKKLFHAPKTLKQKKPPKKAASEVKKN